ncbi:MAG TPA: GTPase HflX, partial [Candidatus Tectomicrobia bacterium]|nr:GTPase HflX [Candidatus Tectomicrobia bacterium]
GTRGPGETQLESDRRVIRRRVMQIRRELEHVQTHRRLQREGRRRAGLPVVALVGYTNAGKTTLLNRLTGAQFVAADQLFVTLDPAARLVERPGQAGFILTDTVGFIRKLPHEVVAAFRATLEELQDADVIVHVVDASHPALEEHLAAVEAILGELGVADRPTVLALNKIDRVEHPSAVGLLASRRGGVEVSAATGEGNEALLAAIRAALPLTSAATLRVPHGDGAAVAACYERGRVVSRREEADAVVLEAELPPVVLARLARYRVPG